MGKITITRVYLTWLILSIIGWIVSWQNGSLWELMRQSVDSSGEIQLDISRDAMTIAFIVISLVYWLISVAVLGIFLITITICSKQNSR